VNETIIRLAARGDGVTVSGRFVAGAVPGDQVESDGTVLPGPNRQDPPCRHFGTCGGCQLQHINDATYGAFLQDRVSGALASHGFADVTIRPPHLSPPHSRRRVALRALKQGKKLMLGFAEARSHRLVDLGQCPVMHPDLWAMVAPLRGLLSKLARDRRPCDVRMTLADQGIDLALAGVEVDGLEATMALTDFAEKYRLARLSLDEGFGLAARWEPEPVTITLGNTPVALPTNAFLQATADGEAALVQAVKDALGHTRQTADLFAGLGTFALALDGSVHAAEGARDAVLALQQAANRTGRKISVEHRDLFRRPLTATELANFQAVVIDPPRAGADDQMRQIAASTVKRVAAVSCNPATFARDARILADGGFKLDWVQPVGQFCWSTHVELVAAFTR
jgi:23S rRNA (uracil1939-C5)-methyltransferase